MYFSIEGQDGVGKTTMINKLKEDLKDKNIIFVQEPYGENSPKLCKDIKNIIYNYDYLTKYQYNLLFSVARIELYNKVISPALAFNKTVISDRSLYSTFAYNYDFNNFNDNVNAYINNLKEHIDDYQLPTLIVLNPTEELRQKHINKRGKLNHLDNTNQEEVKKKYHMLLNNEHITSIIINYDNDEEGYQKLLNRIKGLL